MNKFTLKNISQNLFHGENLNYVILGIVSDYENFHFNANAHSL